MDGSAQLNRMKEWLAEGLDPNEADRNGNTRLHFAIERRQMDLVRFLLAHGANPLQENMHGLSPERLAHYLGFQEVIDCMADNDPWWINVANPGAEAPAPCNGSEFAQRMRVKPLKTLRFSDPRLYRHALRLSGQSDIPLKQKGNKNQDLNRLLKEIVVKSKTGCFSFLCVRWVSEEVGFGLFTCEDLAPSCFVGEYLGVVYETEPELASDYGFFYMNSPSNEKTRLLIDASREGNHTRYMNHSTQPNVLPYLVYFEGLLHHIFLTNQRVSAGTQLTYDYGPFYWKNSRVPIVDL